MLLLRWLLLPISFLYALVVWVRNRLYDYNMLKSTAFDLPIVVIGNLAVGGTGKSPMTEYILRILDPAMSVTVLSRGYGRKTKGFRQVTVDDEATQVGDEPLQIKKKFPDRSVVVCEDRVTGVRKIREHSRAILLDDAFQHRALKPSFSILLFDYDSLQKPMLPLPSGSFRDSLYESKRADIIVITKSPDEIDPRLKEKMLARLRKYSPAKIYFSSIAYDAPIDSLGHVYAKEQLADTTVLLLTGIANPAPLATYLQTLTAQIHKMSFGDHHLFSEADLAAVSERFQRIKATKKIIVSTEKDLQRLPQSFLKELPVVIIPIRQHILFNEAHDFEQNIKKAFTSAQSVNES